MAQTFPYAYYSCPCVDPSPKIISPPTNLGAAAPATQDDEEKTFDPRSPRTNFTLYPIEHLLYCSDCHEIRCPRCVVEEVVCWYCPNCLFEVPSSTVRSDGNRCTRNCYNCPVCTSILSISSLEKPAEGLSAADAGGDAAKHLGGPYFLSCSYCQWSSLDIGVQFEKHFNLTGQLQRLIRPAAARRRSMSLSGLTSPVTATVTSPLREEFDGSRRGSLASAADDEPPKTRIQGDTETMFANLSSFYRTQLAQLEGGGDPYGMGADYNFSSPTSIHRLMNMYSATGRNAKKDRPQPVREALASAEGLKLYDPEADEADIERIKNLGWEGTLSTAQRRDQCREDIHFVDQLRPVATLLRTKKSKRCKECRQILSRPESKVSSNRYKIKLLALNNIPKISLRLLNGGGSSSSSAHPSFPMQATRPDAEPLRPLATTHFLLTINNPLFDAIKVTLATPPTTPGRVRSKVTILCPEFDVGANTDVWDEALNSSSSSSSTDAARRRSAMLSSSLSGGGGGDVAAHAEAGKVWSKGRNWTAVVVEVVPGALPGTPGNAGGFDFGFGTADRDGAKEEQQQQQQAGVDNGDDIDEDEDVLEIAMFVRCEYETDAGGDEGAAAAKKADGGREKREQAFWVVLGAGRIAS